MRGRAFALVAMAFGCMPQQAAAEPVTAAIAYVSSWVAGLTAGQLVLLQVGIGVGLGVLGMAIFRPTMPSLKPSDRLVNTAQPVSYQTRMYGRVRYAGPLGLNVFNDAARFRVVLLAAHSTKGPVEHWLGDWQVDIYDPDDPLAPPARPTAQAGMVSTKPIADYDGSYLFKSSGRIFPYTGQDGQAADPFLVSHLDQWTSAHDLKGISYAVVWAGRVKQEYAQEKFPSGDIWDYAPVWDGNDQIFDPRDGLYKFTRNAALVIAHELTVYHGHTVDWAEVAVEAAICDELVTNGEGGQQARWTIDITLTDDQQFSDIVSLMMSACDGFIISDTMSENCWSSVSVMSMTSSSRTSCR